MTILRNALNPLHWRFSKLWLSRLFLLTIMLLAVGIGGIAAMRVLRTTPPVPMLRGQQLAAELAAAIQADPAVRIASGTYLPDDALILYTQLDSAAVGQTRTWAQRQLEPFLTRLRNLPAEEQLTWIIDQTAAPRTPQESVGTIQQEVLTVKFGLVADPLQYQYVTSALTEPAASSTQEQATQEEDATTNSTATTVGSSSVAQGPAPDQAPLTEAPGAQPLPSSAETLAQPDATADDGESPIGNPTTLRSITFTPTEPNIATPSEWRVISGVWELRDGIYQQLDQEGYDSITLLNLPPQRHYSMDVRLRMNGGTMGGGFLYNAPTQASRAGAQLIDTDEQGRYLRWGYYDADGLYTFVGGVALADGLTDGAWHQLRLVTHGELSTIWFDGQEVGQTVNQSREGYLGLVVSRAQMDFDDLVITALPPTPEEGGAVENVAEETAPLPATETIAERATVTATAILSDSADLTATATPTTTALFIDDFSEGNRNGWQVLDGIWQFLEGNYQQTASEGADLATISPFQGSDYRVTVRMRLLDGNMGAGVLYNMAQRNSKKQSQLIRFNNGGRDLQWGAFDEGGNFVLQGSTRIPNGGDGAWHTLTVDVGASKATFTLDTVTVAKNIALTYSAGYLGLFTAQSRVAFDDITVEGK